VHPISQHVKSYYDRVHRGQATPSSGIPILRGKDLATHLQYPPDVLKDLPQEAWERFLPCGNPLKYFEPSGGERILNLGAGIGIDSLALARVSTSPVEIVNLDVISSILTQSMALASQLNSEAWGGVEAWMSWVCAEGDNLPFGENAFDWVLMNGVFNLFPDKTRLLGAVRYILKPRGRLLVTDLAAVAALPDYFGEELDAWAWCMSGACSKAQIGQMIEASGFELTLFAEASTVEELLTPMAFVARKTAQELKLRAAKT
jgi:arsenite methyltransferase